MGEATAVTATALGRLAGSATWSLVGDLDHLHNHLQVILLVLELNVAEFNVLLGLLDFSLELIDDVVLVGAIFLLQVDSAHELLLIPATLLDPALDPLKLGLHLLNQLSLLRLLLLQPQFLLVH